MDNRDYNGWEDSEVEKSFLKIKFKNEEIPSIKLKSCGIINPIILFSKLKVINPQYPESLPYMALFVYSCFSSIKFCFVYFD